MEAGLAKKIEWEGVFPAVTTQFKDDFSLDLDATRGVMDALIRDGVSGLIVCGTVGENTSLTRSEKIAVMEVAKDVARGRVPVISGIAEFTTPFAIETAREAHRIGIDGIMVMPALVYSSKPANMTKRSPTMLRTSMKRRVSPEDSLKQTTVSQSTRDARISGVTSFL